jgi:hypothetical protein
VAFLDNQLVIALIKLLPIYIKIVKINTKLLPAAAYFQELMLLPRLKLAQI